jgi:lipopolysaccharide transport system permease protein
MKEPYSIPGRDRVVARKDDTGRDREREWIVNAAPNGRWPALLLDQFWTHRELIHFFALRDLKVRYKQAFLGIAWAGIQPVIGALTFTILFNRLAHVNIEGHSYFAFALLGFGIWTYYSTTLLSGTNSLVYNAHLLTKVSFPKIVVPTAAMLPSFIDLAVALILATTVSLASGGSLSAIAFLIGLPLGLAMLVLAVAGPALFLSASLVKYRDASTLVAFALQFLLFASPVAYPPEFVPGAWRTVLYLNPLAGALGLLRAALVGTDLPNLPRLSLSGAVAIVGFLVGLLHFRRSEREFADII